MEIINWKLYFSIIFTELSASVIGWPKMCRKKRKKRKRKGLWVQISEEMGTLFLQLARNHNLAQSIHPQDTHCCFHASPWTTRTSCWLHLRVWLWLLRLSLALHLYIWFMRPSRTQPAQLTLHMAYQAHRGRGNGTPAHTDVSQPLLGLKLRILLLPHRTLSYPHFIDEKAEGLRPITLRSW